MTGAILLATCNGAQWLPEQLESYLAQDIDDWSLRVSDDGSTDGTQALISNFAARLSGRVAQVARGPGKGACRNFLSLLATAPDDLDWVAFSDQDDVWHPQKITRALAGLATAGSTPALYCGRTYLCDAALNVVGTSPPRNLPPSFSNALVQSLAGGNTMVLNRAGLRLAQKHVGHAGTTISHDWWLYQLFTATGGRVIFDRTPRVYYRQHGQNLVGSNHTLSAQSARFNQVCRGRFRNWTDANIVALRPSRPSFTPEAMRIFDTFLAARQRRGVIRLRGFMQAGIHRQTRVQSTSLGAAALFGLV